MTTTTLDYTADHIRAAAESRDGYSITEILLNKGATAWNPASTKGPLYGPSSIVYVMDTAGIRIFERDYMKCLHPHPMNGVCGEPAVTGMPHIRCAEHVL